MRTIAYIGLVLTAGVTGTLVSYKVWGGVVSGILCICIGLIDEYMYWRKRL